MSKLEGTQKIQRYKIGTGSSSTLKVKKTSPGVLTVQTSDPPPSKPQGKQNMGVGGRKASFRHKGRVDPKAAKANDPGQTPFASTKINYITPDKTAQTGFIKNRGWPADSTGGKKSFKISDPPPTRKA